MENLDLSVVSERILADRVRELTLARGDGASGQGAALPDYEPGAHIKVVLPTGDLRSYSLVDLEPRSEPARAYKIAILLDPNGNGGSRFMHQLSVGDALPVVPPTNKFPLAADKPALLIAGGIGVTPIMTMAGALATAGTPFRFHYCGRTRSAMAYHDMLGERFGTNMTFHYDDGPDGPFDVSRAMVGIGPDDIIYACGPRGLIKAVRQKVDATGIAASRVRFELFFSTPLSAPLPSAPQAASPTGTGDTTFEVELKSSGKVFEIPVGKSIIEVLEAGGIELTYDCQRGDCGICQTDVIDGVPDHRDLVLSDAEKASGKVMQICVSRAKSSRLVLDL